MAKYTRLEEAEILEGLKALPDWKYEENGLHREYKFEDFTQAWAFMTGGAILAQALGHHPDWSNAYSQVEITLTTHAVSGVTSFDLDLARKFEGLARKLLPTQTP